MKIIIFTCSSSHPEHRVRAIEKHLRTAQAFMSSPGEFWLINDERSCSYWQESIRALQEPCDIVFVAELDAKTIRAWLPRYGNQWIGKVQENEPSQADTKTQTPG